jgi:hypothetical protein
MNAHELLLLHISDDMTRAVTHAGLHESLAQRVISFAGALPPALLEQSVIAGGTGERNAAWLRWSATPTGEAAVIDFHGNGHTSITLVRKEIMTYRSVPAADALLVCGALFQALAQLYVLVASKHTKVDETALYWRQPRRQEEEERRPLVFDWSSDGEDLF